MTSYRFVPILRGEHVHVRVFAGPDRDHRALTGILVFHIREWLDFESLLDFRDVAPLENA